MISYVNTDELEDIAIELSSATNDLDAEFNALFTRLNNVPTVTKEWVGGQANHYFSRVALDRQQYTNFIDSVRGLGQELSTEASSIQARIKENNE